MAVEARDASRIVNGIPRFGDVDNYSESFGFQWNRFAATQLHAHSSERLWRETGWTPAELDGLDILEAGSGAGRFSRVLLEQTKANLYSFDYSTAVDANLRNNGGIAPDRFHLCQASIYDMPFPDGSFDKVLCLGVLQHTPDFEASVRALVAKAKPGGEIVVDFYPIRGWWTKLHAKYLLRPVAKRMSRERLLKLIERNAGWLVATHRALTRIGLHALTRFLPLVDIAATLPADLSPAELREWAILDTFDMFSPEFDSPQRTSAVVAMFDRAGAQVTHVETGLVRANRI
ncbi:MAG: methyltransferase domain-containing protein [Sphingomicrobium sp.]